VQALNKRAVAVVVDPIQSVKGKVVIDAFRLINPQLVMMGQAPRQTTSNLGHLKKPSIQALIHNLNRHYYSINIGYRKSELEQRMLLNLHKKTWTHALNIPNVHELVKENETKVQVSEGVICLTICANFVWPAYYACIWHSLPAFISQLTQHHHHHQHPRP
jgi:26S proteasome regulatory subunit N11